jgi:hypothetical protein
MNYFPNRLTNATAPMTNKVVTDWKPVDRWTRAGSCGRLIKCPHCSHENRVYHFSWCAVTCQSCKRMVDKSDWSYKQ